MGTVGEIIKRRIPGLHQYLNLYTSERKYTYEAQKEGVENKEETRKLTALKVTLPKTKDNKIVGHYQAPIDDKTFAEIQERGEKAREAREAREKEAGEGGR